MLFYIPARYPGRLFHLKFFKNQTINNWITSKFLQYSAGICVQCYEAAGWEESLGENGCVYVYVYIAESLRYAPETVITLLTSYIPT